MKKFNVLLLGSGGREHALAWKLSRSRALKKLFAAPGSAAIAGHAECAELDITDSPAVVDHARKTQAGLVVIGPEAPLEAGVADALRSAGFKVFGPGKETARLETSKSFAKDFMSRHEIPTAGYQVFTDLAAARSAAAAMKFPLVIKADGLAAGKGVVICPDAGAAQDALTDIMQKKSLGQAGAAVVIEQCIAGPELSLLLLMDSKSFRLLPFSRDHKRIFDGDRGPNTGGMGAFSPVEVDAASLRDIEEEVLPRIMSGLAADKLDFKGVLYVGLMLTADGPRVLEFNCRFGDPEIQAVLPLIKSDFLELVMACAEGDLRDLPLETHAGASVCVTMASEGYPGKPKTGRAITGLDDFEPREDLAVFHAGTTLEAGKWTTSGGRVLGVTATGADRAQARRKAYGGVSRIKFEGMRFRGDIAGPAVLLALRS